MLVLITKRESYLIKNAVTFFILKIKIMHKSQASRYRLNSFFKVLHIVPGTDAAHGSPPTWTSLVSATNLLTLENLEGDSSVE